IMCEGLHYIDGFVVDERKLTKFVKAPRCNITNVINVFKPKSDDSDVLERTSYTLWGNHKLVSYAGKLWDPCYGACYGHLSDFIEYDIQGTGVFMPYCRGVNKQFEEKYFLKSRGFGNREVVFLGPLTQEELKSASDRLGIGKDQNEVSKHL